MRLTPLLLALLACLPVHSALAKGSSGTTGYTADVDGRCEVWAPSMLVPYDYALRYQGGCKNGRAEGKGKAEWLYRWSEMKIKSSWEGEFRNGVFLNGQKIKGNVEPHAGDKYVVDMGTVDGAELRFISRSPQDAPMELCKVDSVSLVLGSRISPADDDKVKRAMLEAGKVYQKACPDSGRELRLGVHTEAIKPRGNSQLPNPMAQARLNLASGELAAYSNEASEKARQEQQQAEFARKQDDTRKRFTEFSRQHGISTWVTTKQLEENPFRWEGKAVGLIVRLDRMLTRDTALVRSGLRDWGPQLQLTGITPEFPESRHTVLLAAQVGKREPLAGGKEGSEMTVTTLRHLDSRNCERDGCSDWLIWARGDRDLVWGEPFSAR